MYLLGGRARVGADGVARLSAEPGVHAAAGNADTVVLTSARLDRPGTETRVLHGGVEVGRIASVAETPVISANVTLLKAGERALPCAVLLPRDHEPGRAAGTRGTVDGVHGGSMPDGPPGWVVGRLPGSLVCRVRPRGTAAARWGTPSRRRHANDPDHHAVDPGR